MAFPDGYAVFEAEHNYQSNHEDEISLKIGDKCYVKEPVINPTGWLLGQNTRTNNVCLLYTSPSPRDGLLSRMPSSA